MTALMDSTPLWHVDRKIQLVWIQEARKTLIMHNWMMVNQMNIMRKIIMMQLLEMPMFHKISWPLRDTIAGGWDQEQVLDKDINPSTDGVCNVPDEACQKERPPSAPPLVKKPPLQE